MKRLFFAAVIVSLMPEISEAQFRDSLSVQEISPVLESLFEGRSEKEISDIQDELEYFHQHPVNVYSATLDDLAGIPFLASSAAEKMLALRDSSAHFSASSLSAIPEIEASALEIILPCLSFEKKSDVADGSWFSDVSIVSRSRVVDDIQPRKGFTDGLYRGSPSKKYQRLELSATQFFGRIVFEQDAGERLNDGFSSFSFGARTDGFLKDIVIGNYFVKTGEGLALSSFGSTSKLRGIFSGGNRSSIVPYSSTDEFHYFRGIAATMNVFPVAVTFMYSNKSVAASIDSGGSISNFYTAGLFRTGEELRKKNAAREQMLGTEIDFKFENYGHVGILALRTKYDRPLLSGTQSYSVYGLNGSANFSGATFFGEAVGNSPSLNTAIGGVRMQVSKKMVLHASIRSYSPGYSDAFAFPFGENNSAEGGEKGIFVGLELHPFRNFDLLGYYDEFTLPTQNEFSTRGNEYFFNASVHANKKMNLTFQYKEKVKTESGSLEERSQQSVRLDGLYRFQKRLTFRQRLELNEVRYSISKIRETGKLAFSEIRYEHASLPVEVAARVVVFETDSYDSRLYEFENDVRGIFSNPPLYGSGMRWYCLSTYDIGTALRISLKYSETIKSGVTVMGSGENEIQGALDNRVTFQIDMML